jgi:hypothetical protein
LLIVCSGFGLLVVMARGLAGPEIAGGWLGRKSPISEL